MSAEKVVLLTNFVPPYLAPLFAALAKCVDHLRVVVSTRMEGNRPWSFQGEGLPVQVQKTLTLRRRWRHPSGFAEDLYLHLPLDTLPILWRERPDVIVSTEFGMRTLQAVLYRGLRPQTRIVLWAPVSEATERGRGGVRHGLRRWLLRRVDAVLVSGESGARYVAGLGFPDAAIFRMPPYAASAAGPEADAERAGRRLLYVGQLVARKGLGAFLDAFAQRATEHPEEPLELRVVGDGPERRALESRQLPPNAALRFCGNVSYAELPATYGGAGILVFPTLADEWGVVVNEALAAGVPVLGSVASQAVDELVEEGRTGWRFRPEHPEELRAALDRALDTPAAELEEMRERCRAQARRFSADVVVLRLLEAIEFAAAGAPRLPETA